jgi:hypothetical protein
MPLDDVSRGNFAMRIRASLEFGETPLLGGLRKARGGRIGYGGFSSFLLGRGQAQRVASGEGLLTLVNRRLQGRIEALDVSHIHIEIPGQFLERDRVFHDHFLNLWRLVQL